MSEIKIPDTVDQIAAMILIVANVVFMSCAASIQPTPLWATIGLSATAGLASIFGVGLMKRPGAK